MKSISRFDDYFTYRGLELVGEGGYLVTIVPSSFLKRGLSPIKEEVARIGTLVDAYRLPEGVFPDTKVGTDILVFQRKLNQLDPNGEKLMSDDTFFAKNPEKIL